jgi:hypothetical protein
LLLTGIEIPFNSPIFTPYQQAIIRWHGIVFKQRHTCFVGQLIDCLKISNALLRTPLF